MTMLRGCLGFSLGLLLVHSTVVAQSTQAAPVPALHAQVAAAPAVAPGTGHAHPTDAERGEGEPGATAPGQQPPAAEAGPASQPPATEGAPEAQPVTAEPAPGAQPSAAEPAPETRQPADGPEPQPASSQPAAAEQPASGAATPFRPQHFRRWTQQDVARVRAALARQRRQRANRRPARRHGDARARVTAGLEMTAVSRPDEGFARFDMGHTSGRLGVFAGYDVLRLTPKLTLMGELGAGIEHDQSRDLLGPATKADLNSQTLHLGVVLRWDALKWLSPQLRAWGGASLFQLGVTGTTVSYDTATATSGFGALGAGFMLHTSPRTFETSQGSLAALQLGLLVELGYALRSSVDFSLHTRPDPRRIDVIDANLGSLRLSGGYLRVAAVVRL